MKKLNKFAAVLICVLMLMTLASCSETAPKKDGAIGKAIALGHGNCVTEVTVAVDGYGNPVKVIFDDIFPANNVYSNEKLMKEGFTDYVEIGDKTKTFYYKYLHIGDKYFEVNDAGLYFDMSTGAGKIADDLMTYYKTTEGTQWYYDSFMAGKLYICAVDEEKGTAVGGVKLSDKYAFNTTNGSMRKRYSRYWSTLGEGTISQVSGLGFNGNMEMLETYILAYGFSAMEKDSAISLPKENGTRFNQIGGVATGATLSADTGIYMKVAYEAYKNALDSAGLSAEA